MKQRIYNFVHLSSYLTITHGVIYYFVKEFMQTKTEYGLRPSEYQSLLQGIHIVLSPMLIFSLGILWKDHILKFFKKKSRKLFSGSILTLTLIFIALSGYLIQVIYNPSGKEISVIVHLMFSAIFIVAYLIHHFQKKS